jgi:hypothetical protein
VAIKHVPLINGRLEDFPALLHLPIHSEHFPFLKKRERYFPLLIIVPKTKEYQRGYPTLLLNCTNIVLCELATCFDRLVSQRMCRGNAARLSKLNLCGIFNLSVDK